MFIRQLQIHDIRNLQTVVLNELAPVNLFYGANGSGKSSVLESIFILASGKSFRTGQVKQFIRHGATEATIFAESDSDIKIGIRKNSDGTSEIKQNGKVIQTQSELAKILPVHIISPEFIELLGEGSKARQRLLDWLMFHVEPSFYPLWLNYQKVLRQRNTLLKSAIKDDVQLSVWEQQLAQHSMQLHQLREGIFHQWQAYFYRSCQELLPQTALELSYLPGFDPKVDLQQQYQTQRIQDAQRGYTWAGAHRADLRIKTAAGGLAEAALSRGQKKLLVMALKLSQIEMLHGCGKRAVVLLDDITAELDQAALMRCLQVLQQTENQLFIAVLDQHTVASHFDALQMTVKMFHVEQGQLTAC